MKPGITIPEWQAGQPSAWVETVDAAGARVGKRVPDKPLFIAATARMLMVERGLDRAEVHMGACGLGTQRAKCTCTPAVLTR